MPAVWSDGESSRRVRSLLEGLRLASAAPWDSRAEEEGQQRTAIELEVDEIAPSLRYATAQVTRAAASGAAQRSNATPATSEEPWATPSAQTRAGEWSTAGRVRR
ncbi:hypothetical protein AB0O14_05930 [Microbacterium foliorum]